MANPIETFQNRFLGRIAEQTGLIHLILAAIYFLLLGLAVVSLGGMELYEYLGWLVINVPVKLAIFYAYFYYFVPNWLGRKTWYFIGVSLLLLILYPPLKYGFDSLFAIVSLPTIQITFDEGEDYEHWIELARRANTIIGMIPFATLVRIITDWFTAQKRKIDLERQQLKGEVDLLRSQVNPHFLFNVLNSIDSLVYKVSPQGSEAIHKLSSIMRYMLYESNANTVLLKNEIEYLSSYFDLQRMRMKEADQVFFVCNCEVNTERVAPMLFIVFVENAFKHASVVNGRREISVEIEVEHTALKFLCRNSFDPNAVEEKDQVGGIGLNNVQRRLDLLYPDRYHLNVQQHEQYYSVYLTLDLEEATDQLPASTHQTD
ncbi:MAG: histidine kinase [Bacteroidota bacterium]